MYVVRIPELDNLTIGPFSFYTDAETWHKLSIFSKKQADIALVIPPRDDHVRLTVMGMNVHTDPNMPIGQIKVTK